MRKRATRLPAVGSLALALGLLALPAGADAAAPQLLWKAPLSGNSGSGAGELRGALWIATAPATGHVFVGDGNARISEFDAWGQFVKAWGWGVRNGAAEPQTCGPGATPPSATCLQGLSGSGPGQFGAPPRLVAPRRHRRGLGWQRIRRRYGSRAGAEVRRGGELPAAVRLAGRRRRAVRRQRLRQPDFNRTGGDDLRRRPQRPGSGVRTRWRFQIQSHFGRRAGHHLAGDGRGGELLRALGAGAKGCVNSVLWVQNGCVCRCFGTASRDSAFTESPIALDPLGNVFAVAVKSGKYEVLEYDASGAPLIGPGTGFPALGSGAIIKAWRPTPSPQPAGSISISRSGWRHFLRRRLRPPTGQMAPARTPPAIGAQYALSVEADAATVGAEINPRFWADTRYYVEWGTGRCAEGGCPRPGPGAPGHGAGGGSRQRGRSPPKAR